MRNGSKIYSSLAASMLQQAARSSQKAEPWWEHDVRASSAQARKSCCNALWQSIMTFNMLTSIPTFLQMDIMYVYSQLEASPDLHGMLC